MNLASVTAIAAAGQMLSFVARRLLGAIPLLVMVILITFALTHMAPGDPIVLLAGESPSPELIAKLRAEYGLDRPLIEQLWLYFKGTASLDFGTSIYYQRPALDIILDRVPATLLLTGTAIFLASIFGIVMGVAAARRRDRPTDTVISTFSTLGYSIPSFWLGQLLILLFAVTLGWLPSGGMVTPRYELTGMAYVRDVAAHLILPAITLMTFELALISRFTRTAMVDALAKDYVTVARAKGAAMRRVVWRHALPNALVPTVTIIGLEVGVLLAGAVVTETVFAWPGLGRLFYEAIARRDFPLLNACFIFASLAVVIVNLLTDLIAAALDPRVRR